MKGYSFVGKGSSLKDLLRELSTVKEFPCSIHLYDRVFILENKNEAWSLINGIEVGWYLKEEQL